MSSCNSVDRVPAQGHGFDSCRGLRFFLFFHACVMYINSSFNIFIVAFEFRTKLCSILYIRFQFTLVPETFFYSLLTNFATRIASYIFFIGTKRWEPRKESLWSRPLGTSLSCHQLLTVNSDWRTFLIALWVIWLDGLTIFGDGSGVYMFTFMGMGGELLLYQPILLPGKAKIFVVEFEYNSMML